MPPTPSSRSIRYRPANSTPGPSPLRGPDVMRVTSRDGLGAGVIAPVISAPIDADSSAEQAIQRPVVSGVSVRHCGQTIGFAAAGRPEPPEVAIILPEQTAIQVQLTDPDGLSNSGPAQNDDQNPLKMAN